LRDNINLNKRDNDVIGEKIRGIRKSKNLTIVELSEQINVTSGYISQIERDLISPSLAVLKRLADALEIPLSVLFMDDKQENVVTTSGDARTKVKFGNINVEFEYITPIVRNGEKTVPVEVFLFKLPAKMWVSDSTILHDSKVILYVLRGKLECHIGEKIYNVSMGDSICVPEKTAHMIYNSFNEETEIICVLSPAAFI
jgi:transcriptional regulator with XRE-family HTH domain